MGDTPRRLPPGPDADTAFFWEAAAAGRLEIMRCQDCRTWLHPPAPVCRSCSSRDVAPEAVSGRGVVWSFTVNHQTWNPLHPPPYVIAIVELEEQPALRLTTNLVDCQPGDVAVGMPVEARFEPDPDKPDRIGYVLFAPAPPASEAEASRAAAAIAHTPRPFTAAVLHDDPLEHRAVITGAGQSEVGRKLGRTDLDLAAEASLAAISDAGLTVADIDGLSAYPGAPIGPPGFGGVDPYVLQDALGLEVGWHHGGLAGPGQLGAVIAAAMAVAAGLARHVLVYRSVSESSSRETAGGIRGAGGTGGGMGGHYQWLMPYGAYSAANWIAQYASRYRHQYGLTREQLAGVALNGRRHAALNPKAVFRDPLTLQDYLDARTISSPLCLFDCDVPCDGVTAVIVSHRDTAADAPKPPVRIEAVGTALRGRPSWDQWDDLTTFCASDCATQMWSRTSLTPADLDAGQLYDGFSILTLLWLEALGVCGTGEAAAFLEDWEKRFALDGSFPLNTSGGQLSAGRLHGFGLLHEAVIQLRGEAGDRQIAGEPEVMAVAAGGGPVAGSLLLTR